ncbi:hypothetical protein CFE70_001442 [Pyrenophora teres f. teres 0-1]
MPDQQHPISKNAYVTLLTRPSYLAGALLLAYTLTKHSPTTPLIITYTPSTLPASSITALQREAAHSNIILHPVEHLRLPESQTAHGMVAERFIDTWTKLRVFDLWELENGRFERLCWLDADMMIFSDPSPLVFGEQQDAYLKGGDGMRVMATWRYWHTNFWKDDEVAVLHYIVDKPWAARVDEQGKAGYLGKDGETHAWWWDEFARWQEERKGQGEHELLETAGMYAAGEGSEVSEEMRAIGGGAQDFAKKWEGKEGGNKVGGEVRRKSMLGERGHGPVVRDL